MSVSSVANILYSIVPGYWILNPPRHAVNRVHHKFMYGTLTSPAVVASDGLLVLSQVNDILAMVYREVKRISKNTTDAQIDEAKGVCMNFILMIFDWWVERVCC